MKPSTIYARWIKSNSARLATEDVDFQHLVASVSFYLDMIEMNPKGLSQGVADSAVHLFGKLQSEIKGRGMEPPAINLPKIKVVKPLG